MYVPIAECRLNLKLRKDRLMMKLSEIRTAYEDLSGKLSDISRQLCFAGFAVIWIYNKSENNISVPQELYLPAFLLCLSLFLDIMQYVVSSLSWYIFYLKKRKGNSNDDDTSVKEPEKLNIVPWILFGLKIIALIIGYFYIGIFLIAKI